MRTCAPATAELAQLCWLQIRELQYFPEEEVRDFRHVANYVIDCEGRDFEWAQRVQLQCACCGAHARLPLSPILHPLRCRLNNGSLYGKPLARPTILGPRSDGNTGQGTLAVCSQPLHTNREWLRNWVQHYLDLGAEKVIMHAPRVRAVRSASRNLCRAAA